jgi:enamine deaminase RidA (YjgF/YER057c/UK114 family)
MPRESVAANRPWVALVGYSRAVRVGQIIEVGGTTSTDPTGNVLHKNDVYAQTREALRIVEEALIELGASVEDVVRTRIFLKDITCWEEAGRAHGELFSSISPTSTFLEAGAFLHPDILVEIEATAILEL